MNAAFVRDVRRYAPGEAALGLVHAQRLLLRHFGLQALLAYRLGRCLLESRASWWLWPIGWPVYFLISRFVRAAFDIRLHLSAKIGPGLYIGHFGGIELEHCRLGECCSIAQSVRIGPGKHSVGPVIEERVWIGAHAKVLGPVHIGAGSTISAGSIVTQDVPPGTLCIGSPARVARQGYDNRSLLGMGAERGCKGADSNRLGGSFW